MELSDITGVGPSRADDLVELGYESVESIANADPNDLTELSRVGEDKALEMVVDAQNLLNEAEEVEETEEVDEEESITFEEEEIEEAEPEVEEVEEEFEDAEEDAVAEEEVEEVEEVKEDTYDVSFELSPRQNEIIITALLESHTELRSNNRARSKSCDAVLKKLRDGTDITVNTDELNAIHAAVRQKRLEYQGNNHIDLMQDTMEVEEQISTVREEYLF